jgi:hypothetical protein
MRKLYFLLLVSIIALLLLQISTFFVDSLLLQVILAAGVGIIAIRILPE